MGLEELVLYPRIVRHAGRTGYQKLLRENVFGGRKMGRKKRNDHHRGNIPVLYASEILENMEGEDGKQGMLVGQNGMRAAGLLYLCGND